MNNFRLFLQVRAVKEGIHEKVIINVDDISNIYMEKGQAETTIALKGGKCIPVKDDIDQIMGAIASANVQQGGTNNVHQIEKGKKG